VPRNVVNVVNVGRMWAVETVAPPRLRWMEGNVRECEGTREGMLARLGERDFEVQRHIPPGSPHSPFTHSPFTTITSALP
jgi:hypothetical protein